MYNDAEWWFICPQNQRLEPAMMMICSHFLFPHIPNQLLLGKHEFDALKTRGMPGGVFFFFETHQPLSHLGSPEWLETGQNFQQKILVKHRWNAICKKMMEVIVKMEVIMYSQNTICMKFVNYRWKLSSFFWGDRCKVWWNSPRCYTEGLGIRLLRWEWFKEQNH